MAPRSARPLDPALARRVAAGDEQSQATNGIVQAGGWLFAAMLLAAAVVMADEWARLTPDAGAAAVAIRWAATLVPMLAVLLLLAGMGAAALLVLALGALAAAGIGSLLGDAPVDRLAGGIAYVGLPLVALLAVRQAGGGTSLALWLLLVVWATDSCAYFAGRAIGGPRLAPRISPGKTWAGLLGGMAGAALIGGLFAWAARPPVPAPLLLAMILAVVAQAGDLFESWLKRRAGLKDSGSLIPGHGGFLDRVDGLLFAAPAFAAVILLGQPPVAP